MRKTVVGIDPSLRATAICYGPIDRPRTLVFSSRNRGDDVANRIQRFEEMASRVADTIGEINPGMIVIEGYSFGSKNHRAEAMAEYGGLLRRRLLAEVRNIVEIAPRAIKKWAARNGNASKDQVAQWLTDRYRVEFGSHDEFDAYAAWRIGWQMLELDEPKDHEQRELIAQFDKRFRRSAG